MSASARTSAATSPDSLLDRGLGVRQLAATIFNYTVGSGIFVLPALAVAQLGTAAPLAYLLCAVVMGLVVLVFAEAGSRVSATGGPYAYVETALGPLTGFVAGVLLSVNDIAAAGAIAALLAGSVARILGVAGALAQGVITTVLLAGLAAINIRGVRWGARVVEVFTAAKLIPLLFFVVVGAFFVSPANLRLDALPSASSLASTAGVLLFAFTGIEAALLPSGEVRDPARTVPRAAILALGFTTLLYLAVQAVGQAVMGRALAGDDVAPLATAAGTFAGRAGLSLLLVGASISMFGWLTGSLLAGPRGLFALARDGFLPRRVATVHPRFQTPHVAIALYAALALGLALSGTFERLAVLSNLAALGLYFLSAIAMWVLRRRGVRGDGEPFRIPGGPIVPALACAVVAWVIGQTITAREFAAFGVVLAVALVVWVARRVKRG
ncbi:MAG: APC family permease [Gemmatimonadetes bacterium]|nr:APC family permease [Gemmatimonadota bacterium]